ncbi:MAG TPA: hypothetical protein VNS58_13985 [Puia sp.]|nr:hypothetical protein [Puia sp.]
MRLLAISPYAGILLFCCLYSSIRAQSTGKDSIVTQDGYYNALQVYHHYLTPETRLYRGSQYVEYAYWLRDGHPFFDDGRLQKGTIFYDSILYEGILLLYDLVKEQVVISDSYDNYKLFLINEQLDHFTIQRHLFITLKDSLNPSAPRHGFYEQLYKDRITLLKKEKKVIMEDLTTGKVEKFIDASVSYYLKKGAVYYAVNNKQSLLSALNDRHKEIKKFIRKNGLSMRHDKENTLLQVAAWYNGQLSDMANK